MTMGPSDKAKKMMPRRPTDDSHVLKRKAQGLVSALG